MKTDLEVEVEVDLRPLGKVIIFRDKQNLPIIYRFKMGLEFLIRAKPTLSSFGDSCASPSSTLLCSRAKDGVIVS